MSGLTSLLFVVYMVRFFNIYSYVQANKESNRVYNFHMYEHI